jgi:hypothetical protein
MADTACSDHLARTGEDLWFPPEKEDDSLYADNDPVWDEPRAICESCPVREMCLEIALEYEPPSIKGIRRHGMYGGLTPHERARLEYTRR